MGDMGLSVERPDEAVVGPTVIPLPRIRIGRRADLDALYELELRCFGRDAAARRSLAYSLSSPIQTVLVAEMDGIIVGSAIVWFSRLTARLYSISVDQEYRRRWIGVLLLKRAERLARDLRCRTMRLEVRMSNRAAIKFYARNLYLPVGRRPKYYNDGTDALRFEKEL